MPDLLTTFAFTLEIDSVEMATFKKCSGIESETEIVEFKEATKEGRMIIRKAPGAMKWSDITLERRIDNSASLWQWRKQVVDGDIEKLVNLYPGQHFAICYGDVFDRVAMLANMLGIEVKRI